MPRKVIVVASAYTHDFIKQNGGQASLLNMIHQAGADGVEIRRELLENTSFSFLTGLSGKIKQHRLRCYYSVPFPLFADNGQLNPDIAHYFAEARALDAELIKFSLGHYQPDSEIDAFALLLNAQRCRLVVENDQTAECATLARFKGFFAKVEVTQLPIEMTFDTGNWSWVGEDAESAAQTLSDYVGYIHVKATKQENGKIHAIPPQPYNDRWLSLIHRYLPADIPLGIEFPLTGENLIDTTAHYVKLLKANYQEVRL